MDNDTTDGLDSDEDGVDIAGVDPDDKAPPAISGLGFRTFGVVAVEVEDDDRGPSKVCWYVGFIRNEVGAVVVDELEVEELGVRELGGVYLYRLVVSSIRRPFTRRSP